MKNHIAKGSSIKTLLSILTFLTIIMASFTSVAKQHFDYDDGNAPFEIIIPKVIPVIIDDVSPMASDPSLIFRITSLLTNSWFDAIAPYHPTAVGVYTRFEERQMDLTNKNKNIAIFYASYQVLSNLFPQHKETWKQLLMDVGLDPDNKSETPTTAIGIGNIAGKAVISNRINDGMNQQGNEGGCIYNCEPYADYLGYKPVNTAYFLNDPSRWQPAFVTSSNGLFNIQQFVTPQLGVTQAYSYQVPEKFRSPEPQQSQIQNYLKYKEQADEVLAVSAGLTDRQKMAAELFDHKFNSVFAAVASMVEKQNISLVDSVILEFATNMASFDTAITIWNDKLHYDSVRPFSAIAHLYGDSPVTAWGGPGKGKVNDLPGKQWTSYMKAANHPEYPSATASFCAAHAQVIRAFFGSDDLGFSVTIPAGSSNVEPGLTPENDVVFTWENWTDLENECGLSRLWGGVHFRPSITAGMDIGHTIGDIAYDFVMEHVNGTANKSGSNK